jgi:hypothetical protein
MRLVLGVLVVVSTLMVLQSIRPECSMSDMVGVEWIRCLML